MQLPAGLYRPLIFTLIGAVLLGGCTNLRNEISPGLLGVELPKLVVSCFLSPQDTLLAVKVTRSNTVVGDSISLLQAGNNVTDATVTLSEGNRSVTLVYNSNPTSRTGVQTFYSVGAQLLPIVTGHTYKLTVSTPNGQVVSSTCTIPAPVLPTSVVLDSIDDVQNRTIVRRYFVKAYWQDPPDQTNYYQVAGIFRYTTSVASQEERYSSLTFDDDNRGLFPDTGLDGTEFVSGRAFLTSSSTSSRQSGFNNQYKTVVVTVNLMSVDQAYFRFQEATIRQRRSRNNPFAEPVLIPSNITGGLGCFAGYNNATLTKTLK